MTKESIQSKIIIIIIILNTVLSFRFPISWPMGRSAAKLWCKSVDMDRGRSLLAGHTFSINNPQKALCFEPLFYATAAAVAAAAAVQSRWIVVWVRKDLVALALHTCAAPYLTAPHLNSRGEGMLSLLVTLRLQA